MKLGVAVALLFLAVPLARANSMTCFTLSPGESIITSLPPCPPPVVITPTVSPPAPIVTSDDQGEDNDDQGDVDTGFPPLQPGTSGIFAFNAPPVPVSAPEPAELELFLMGLGALFILHLVNGLRVVVET